MSSVFVEDGEPHVRMRLPEGSGTQEAVTALQQIRVNANVLTDGDIVLNGDRPYNAPYTKDHVMNYVGLLHDHIQRITEIHTTDKNPAYNIGAYGYFTPHDMNNRARVHIDAYAPRVPMTVVIDTIAEEVSHFGWHMWKSPKLDKLTNKLFDTVGEEAMRVLPHYVKFYDVDVNNPTLADKEMLINEYFSKMGMSVLDLTPSHKSLPEGMTESTLEDIKKDAIKTIQEVAIDLTKDKDFNGTKEEAQRFVEKNS